MSLLISDELVKVSGLFESEPILELIVLLFQQEKITLARASRLAGMTQIQFQRLLTDRKIPVHYDVEDLQEDIANLKEVGLLCSL
jgi:predicted HTH domain antitoxin